MLTGSSTQPAEAAAGYAVALRGIDFAYCSAPSNGAGLYSHFDLTIAEGSVVALMGPSGSGKSTLGKMMAGIIRPTAGRIEWSDRFRRRSDVVYVDQQPMNSIFPWHTVMHNLRYPLQRLGWTPADIGARVGYLASLFRLGPLLDCLPAQLSGGELQRLALARSLSWRPELVILDEPFSALDREIKSNLTLALQKVAAQDGMTLVFITHNVSDALGIGMRHIIIGDRPVRILTDLEFKNPYPRDAGALDYDAMEQSLIAAIREGLV